MIVHNIHQSVGNADSEVANKAGCLTDSKLKKKQKTSRTLVVVLLTTVTYAMLFTGIHNTDVIII